MGAAAGAAAGADAAGAASTAAGGASAASTALPFVGLGVNLLQTGMGLVQASEQAAAQREAERKAEIATKMRIQQQEQEFFKKVQIPMEAYNRALREGTAQQSQAIGALQEGDTRQLLGAIGKVNAVGVDQIAGLTDEMAQKMFDKSKLQAQEGMLGADDLAKIYEDRALGAQKAAGAAELAQFGALNSALIGVTDFATRIDAGRNEYKKSQAMPAISNTGANISGVTGTGDGYNFVNTSNQSPVGSMLLDTSKQSPAAFRFNDQNTGFNFPSYSVSSPENIGSNFMSSTPTFNPYVSAGYNKKPTVDIFGNIIR
jgi:hypothetical protein